MDPEVSKVYETFETDRPGTASSEVHGGDAYIEMYTGPIRSEYSDASEEHVTPDNEPQVVVESGSRNAKISNTLKRSAINVLSTKQLQTHTQIKAFDQHTRL
ncbi:hypothetical protein GN244_ATG04773 [Phytophthora infestans]|uniref:Uncharacterized protein n=1 Tax=Phytophthora infestans TaxID=4787 RepID=A0A833SXV7_PHYIN|nr:hypothetical protein GN244_ATG04773 [Phytophthora infestans]